MIDRMMTMAKRSERLRANGFDLAAALDRRGAFVRNGFVPDPAQDGASTEAEREDRVRESEQRETIRRGEEGVYDERGNLLARVWYTRDEHQPDPDRDDPPRHNPDEEDIYPHATAKR